MRRRTALAMGFALVLALGCGGPAGRRMGLSGTVTFRGQPLDTGTIQFRAPAGAGGEATVGVITNGRYTIPAAQGLPPGMYEVVISSSKGDPPKVGEGYGLAAERLPATVNSATTLKAEVTAQGPNRFDFPIP